MIRIGSRSFPLLSLIPILVLGCAHGVDDPNAEATQSQESSLSVAAGGGAIAYDKDRFLQDAEGPFVQVDMLVRNRSASKQVGARGSFDGRAWKDYPASFVESLPDGRERWRVQMRNGSQSFSGVEYALYLHDPASGRSYWDNNRQNNFKLGVWDRVHRVGDRLEDGKLTIELDVRNLAYDKTCMAVVTTDGWVSQTWARGDYAFPTELPEIERWHVEVDLGQAQAAWGLNPKASVFEYAVACQMAGGDFWDNANTSNYRLVRSALPDLAWTTAFEGATQAALGDDGTSFVVSSGSWISSYGPDGTWRFAREAPGMVTNMVWLRHARLLAFLASVDGQPSRWVAWDADGNELWAHASNASKLAVGERGEYLVGADGGFRIGREAPVVMGPQGGCWLGDSATGSLAFPIVSRGGKMYCLDAAGTIQGYDLDQGVALGAWAGDWPWATSDDGGLVVVSNDRTTLTGYGPRKAERWTKTGLYVAVDSQYGNGDVCTNHAANGLALLMHQDPAGGGPESNYFEGFDPATGEQRFRAGWSTYGLHPCAGPDGAFYYRPGYERYGRSLRRISEKGQESVINLGWNGSLFGIDADGRTVRRDWGYYPSDRGRIAVTEGNGTELYSTPFFSTTPGSYVAAQRGNRLLVAEPGRVTMLVFPAP